MALSRGRRYEAVNYWPGFVDALSTMLLVIIFLLSVFMLAQFFLSREVTGKDEALARLNRQIEELTNLLALERTQKSADESKIATLTATLDTAERERKRLKDAAAQGAVAADAAGAGGRRHERARPAEGHFRPRAGPGRRAQPADRGAAQAARGDRGRALSLGSGEQGDRSRRSPISGRGSMSRWRRRCRSSTATAPTSSAACGRSWARARTFRVVGDRFVFQILGSVRRRQGRHQPGTASSRSIRWLPPILDLEREIPPDIPWILRVDGHTDNTPLTGGGQYKSNWELSAARAVSVVQYLISKGVEPDRLAAAGFGEFQPIDQGTDEEFARPQPPDRTQADGAVSASTRACATFAEADLPALIDLWVAAWRETGFAIDFDARRAWLENRLRALRADGAEIVGRPRRGGRAGRLRRHRSEDRRISISFASRLPSAVRGSPPRSSTRPSGVRRAPSNSK